MFEIGKVYHVKKFEEMPEKFPKCGLERDSYKYYLCDTIVRVGRGGIYSNPNWGTFYRCVSCDPRKNWKYSFCINESLLEEV